MGKRYEFGEMLDQFRKSLLRELDYRQELSNLKTLRDNLQSSRASSCRSRSPTTAPRRC
jgi:predicted unusual protein kinase regulating ubiquinone biosynthesis (AarF/ABC1/UbiB family)